MGLTGIAAVARVTAPRGVVTFVICAVALAASAALMGLSVEQVGERLGPGATGLLHQSCHGGKRLLSSSGW